MPMATGPASPEPLPMVTAADLFAKDAILSWFRGEFAAANAIIDALCGHLAQFSGTGVGSEYEAVFAAIHRRRLNWIPVLQMQKYHPIADVTAELRKVTERKMTVPEEMEEDTTTKKVEVVLEKSTAPSGENDSSHNHCDDVREAVEEVDSPHSAVTDSGSQVAHHDDDTIHICSNHDDCGTRNTQIKLTKGFNAKEHVKGHMVNVVKGLKLYEDIFTDSELNKLTEFVNELRVAGQNGQLSGETYISFNKQMKGNRRELTQFGIPIFGHVTEENRPSCDLEPIPDLLQDVIEHLIQWQLIPEYKRPNGSIIQFFDEEEYSQPFLKPPHLEQPISTLVLSEATMAFGRILVSDNDGNYRGPLTLSLKQGSLLVMRGNSADLARHVLCSSPNKRVCITFFRVRPESNQTQQQSPPSSPVADAMTVWQAGVPSPCGGNGLVSGYDAMEMYPKWGVVRSPMVMLAPMQPMVVAPKRMIMPRGGTGVFLPWAVGGRANAKHLPPRAQRTRLLALPSPVENSTPNAGIEA